MNPPEFISLPRDRALFAPAAPTILMYHKVGPLPLGSNLPTLYVSPADFARQLDELLAAGLPCLSLDRARDPTPGFCLTFDDGFRNVFEYALPILQSRGLRAIQFIVAGLIGRDDVWDRAVEGPRQPLMDDAQIRDWLAAGHEIGAHTMTHPHLGALPLDRARAEIFDSKHLLEDRFGQPIRHFCYPYGDYTPAVRDLVAEAGYASACTIAPGENTAAVDPFELHRVIACGRPRSPRRLLNSVIRRLRPTA